MTSTRHHPAPPSSTPGAEAVPAPADGQGRRDDCHFCGSVLPRGRAVTFCPYCGQDVTTRQCPACSAELDVGWRFCVCCGRGAEH